MQKALILLLAAMAAPALAGDLWEITSTSTGPDGSPETFTEKKCLPKDGMNPSQALGDLGNCKFDQKSGDAAAITFTMTCKLPGMPDELAAMKVAGDAKLNGDNFDMRYTITVDAKKEAPGADFKMSGSAKAHKTGQCEGPQS